MAKPLFQDIIPPERRSIKHIPVPRHNDDRTVPIRHEQEPVRRIPEPVHHEYEPTVIRPKPQPSPEALLNSRRPIFPPTQPKPQQQPQYHPHPELQPIQRPAPRYETPQFGEDHPNPRFDVHRPQPPVREKRSIVPRVVITLLIIGVILSGAVWAMSRVTASTVTITPKQESVTVDSQFTANKQSTDGLQFQIVTYAKDGKLAVTSNGQEQAQTKASGIITIYNSGASEQTLVANTRFQTDKGLIFRISQPVTIPAASNVNGKKVPGSVE
ncbi:MAG: hypothetical protein M3Q73_03460, partial [bacterium]|nr:hypothetical protein [bacterium]